MGMLKGRVIKSCVTCGSTFTVKNYRRHTARFCSSNCWTKSKESRLINSSAMKKRHKNKPLVGNLNSNWKGGNIPDYKKRLLTPEWRKVIRRRVLDFYGKKCLSCGSENKIIIHHTIPYRYGGSDNVSNLKPVCKHCHRKVEEEDLNKLHQKAIDKYCYQCDKEKESGSDCGVDTCPIYPYHPHRS